MPCTAGKGVFQGLGSKRVSVDHLGICRGCQCDRGLPLKSASKPSMWLILLDYLMAFCQACSV